MNLERKYLTIAIIAVVLAVPLAFVLQHRTHQLKIEKSQNSNLQLQLNSRAKELQLKNTQIQQEQQKSLDLQKQVEDKDKQLQSKREAAQQRLAAARARVAAPVVVYAAGNCDAFRGLVAQYNWNVNIAMAVMRAESGCNPVASSPTCDHGLMQVNCVHSAAVGGNLGLLNDPATNIRVAYAIYRGAGGWSPWTTYTSGAYLRYI